MTKTCTRCGEEKDLELGFAVCRKAPDGRQWRCRTCNSILGKAWAVANKDKIRDYYLANREMFLAKAAKQREDFKEELPAYRRQYREKNRDKLRAKDLAYRQRQDPEERRRKKLVWQRANPDMVRAGKARRRCVGGGGFTAKDVAVLFMEQQGLCAYCQISLDNLPYHVDHVVPLCKGGGNGVDNICLACPSCNLSKQGRLFGYEWCTCSKAAVASRVSKSNELDL